MSLSPAEITLASLMVPLLAASAFFSASETTLFGLSADDRASLRRSAPRTSRAVDALLVEPRQLLITVILGNMTVNTLYFVIGSMLITRAELGLVADLAVGAGTLIGIVLLGEVIPKLVSDASRLRTASILAGPLLALHTAILPLRAILDRGVIAPIARLTAPGAAPPRLTREELAAMLEQSGAAGVINADEEQVLRGVFELRRLRVRDVMTPRVDMAWIAATARRDAIVELVRSRRLTRLPVVGRGIDDILGVLQVKRYLLDPRGAATPLREHVRHARFIPEHASVEQLLEEFRAVRGDLAVVVDEYGGTSGIVAIEDCVEQIVGDIVSPEEEPEPAPQEIDPGMWRVSGAMNLQRWSDAFGERFLHSRASTLGGFLLERLGRPAMVGDSIHLANLRLEVAEVRGSRVRSVLVELDEHAADDEPEAAHATEGESRP